jgi:hypothetical protein
VDGQAAHSHAHSGLTLASVVLVSLHSEFHDFRDQILFCCSGVFPPHLFLVYLYSQHVETNTYTKK